MEHFKYRPIHVLCQPKEERSGITEGTSNYSINNCICHWNYMRIHNEKAATREPEDIFPIP